MTSQYKNAKTISIFSTEREFAYLKDDGSVVLVEGGKPVVKAELSNGIVDVYSNNDSFAFLTSSNTLLTYHNSEIKEVPLGILSVEQVASTNSAFAALLSDGSIITWGNPETGGNSSSITERISNDVKKIFATDSAFAALKGDGSVITWGDQARGGSTSDVSIELLADVVDISSTKAAFAAIKSNGKLVTWGHPDYGGDFRNNSTITFDYPDNDLTKTIIGITEEEIGNNVVNIAATSSAFAALKSDGSVVTWGFGSFGRIGYFRGEYGGDSSLVKTYLKDDVVKLFSNELTFSAIKSNGEVITWGGNLGDFNPSDTRLLEAEIISNIFAFVALTKDGEIFTWGDVWGGGNQQNITNVQSVAATSSAFSALLKDGSVISWGSQYEGGDNSAISHQLENISQIFSNNHSFAALTSSGTVYTWGDEENFDPLPSIIYPDFNEILTVNEREHFEIQIKAIDDDVIEKFTGNIPNWLSLDSRTGILSGTPGQNEVGRHDVIILAYQNEPYVTNNHLFYPNGYVIDQIGSSQFSIYVENFNDAPNGDVLIFGSPYIGRNLVVDTSQVSDDDGLGPFSYQWMRDGHDIPEASTTSYSLDKSDIGAEITVRVSYTDAFGASEFLLSKPTEIITRSPESRVNLSIGPLHSNAQISALADGGFVIVWQSKFKDKKYGIFGQIYDVDGGRVGREFQVSSTTVKEESRPIVTSLSDGGFVVFWEKHSIQGVSLENYNNTPHGTDVYARRFAPDGSTTESETIVNSSRWGWQQSPSTASLGDDNSVVVWQSSSGIYGKFFNSTFDFSGNDILLDSSISKFSKDPSVASFTNGDFAVAWVTNDEDGDERGIAGKVFDGSGAPKTVKFQINEYVAGHQLRPVIETLSDGSFVVVWFCDERELIAGRRFDSQGKSLSDEFIISAVRERDFKSDSPEINALDDGSYIVAWTEWSFLSGHQIYGKVFNSQNQAAGDKFEITTFNNRSFNVGELLPSLARIGNDLVVTWGSNYDIYAQRFDHELNIIKLNENVISDVEIVGEAKTGEVLVAVFDNQDKGKGIEIKWMADGEKVESQSSSELLLDNNFIGKVVTAAVISIDSSGESTTLLSASVGPIIHENTAPTGTPTITGTARQGEIVTANTSAIEDADGLGAISYQWMADGVNVSGATGSTLTLTQAHVGKAISVTASYTDSFGQAESVTSDPRTIEASSQMVLGITHWKTGKALQGVGVGLFDGAAELKTGSDGTLSAQGFPDPDGVDDGQTVLNPTLAADPKQASITLTDVLGALKVYLGKPLPEAYNIDLKYIAADFDGNGTVNLRDVLGLLKFYLNKPVDAAPAWVFVDIAQSTTINGQTAHWSSKAEQTLSNSAAAPAPILADLNSDTPVQMVGVLRGDVDGSWVQSVS